MAWHRGGQIVERVSAFKPIVGWKNAHPQSVGLDTDFKQISVHYACIFECIEWLMPVFAFLSLYGLMDK
jgi:hypothetical protein